MKSTKRNVLLFLFLLIAQGIWKPAQAQTQPRVDVNINASEYDVLFLTEIFSARTQKLSAGNTSGFSVDLSVRPPDFKLSICVGVSVMVKLRGDAGFQPLVRGVSRSFPIDGRRTLNGGDFAGSGIANINGPGKQYDYFLPLKRRISDLAQTTLTAPPGTYQITVIAFDSTARNVTAGGALGKDTKTIVIPYSSVDEVFVEINDPKNGSFFTNLAPTFSWTTSEKEIKLSVYEVGTNHHSPQDVLTGGNPCLIWNSFSDNISSGTSTRSAISADNQLRSKDKVQGSIGTSLTYPSNARRQLQENTAYVMQIEARVQTNRGPMMRPSRPAVFRISDDRIGKILDNFMNTLSDNLSAEYSILRSDPSNWIYWLQYGDMTLDGKKLTDSELQEILKDLANRRDVKFEFDVENR